MRDTRDNKNRIRTFFVVLILLCGFCFSDEVSATQISNIEEKQSEKPTLSNGIPGMEQADVIWSNEFLKTVTSQTSDDSEADVVTYVQSSELSTPHNWELTITEKTLTATIYNESAKENADTLLKVLDSEGNELKSQWGTMSDKYGNLTMDMSDTTVFVDGIYTITLFEETKDDGYVWSLASYPIQIVDGIVSFAPGGCSDIEQAFLDNLNKNYNPDLYDEIPLKYYPEEANTIYLHYAADNLDEMIAKAQELTTGCTTDEQRVKAIHDWVCEEFAYDYEALYANDYDNQADAEWVFENKRAVCSGFSRMTQVLLTSVGVPCMNVTGYADGEGLVASDASNSSNHEWNVVYLNGSWRIMDFTWDCENRYYGADSTSTTLDNAPGYTYYGITPFCYGSTHCSQEIPGELYSNNQGSYYTDFYVEKIVLQNTPTATFDIGDSFSGVYNLLCYLSDGSTKTRNVDGTICAFGYDMTKNGYQMLTVTYGGKSVKYEILVGSGCIGEHSYLEWNVLEEATCVSSGLKCANCEECNKYCEDIVSDNPKHEVSSGTEIEKPTCTAEGMIRGVCDVCGDTVDSVIPRIDHNYTNGVVTKEPTCYSVGERTLTCTMCGGITTEDIEVVEHEYENTYTVDKEPTCKEKGSKSYHCKWYEECQTVSGVTTMDITDNHDYDDGVVTTEPTCMTKGEKTFTCSICEGITTEEMSTIDHEYETTFTIDKTPTCKEEGSKSYHCKWYSVCQAVSGVTVMDTTDNHDYDDGVVTKAPTCSIVGERTHTCKICERTKIEDEPTIAHEYETTYTIDKESSCKEEGVKSYHCKWYSDCKASDGSVAIEKTNDHVYDDGAITKAPTCMTEGVKTFTCTICEGTRTESVDVVSHSYEEDYTVDKEATCVAEGSESRHCVWYELCGQFVDEAVIEINDNHSFDEGEITTLPSCTKEGVRTFTCVLCSYSKTGVEPMSEHVAGEWIVDKEASYTEAGSRHKECAVCHVVMESESIACLEQEPAITPDAGQGDNQNTQPGGDQNAQQGGDKNTQSSDNQNTEETPGSDVGEYIDPDSYEELEEDDNWNEEIKVSGGSNYYLVCYDEDGEVTVTYAGPKDLSVSEVVIPSAIAMDGEVYQVTAISDNAFAKCKKLKTVKMSKYITKIGKNAFSGCSKLTKVNLSSNVTAIGSGAFAKCTSLKSITIPKSVKKIGSKAFYNCKKLKKITIKTTSLKSSTVGSKAFSGIEKKATVKVPKKKVIAYKTLLKKKGLPKKATVRRG